MRLSEISNTGRTVVELAIDAVMGLEPAVQLVCPCGYRTPQQHSKQYARALMGLHQDGCDEWIR